MKVFLPATLMLLLCTGCAAPQYHSEEVGEEVGEETGQRRVQFICNNNEAIEMRFFPLQGVGVLVRNGSTVELQQQPMASGFLYSNSSTTVRGKGDELIVEIGRMVPLECRAR